MDERSFVYAIDPDNRVASVSDSWLEFARDNNASELTRAHVLGQPLWRFIAGEQTQRLYQTLFGRVRDQQESIEVPFRCDSPDRFRFMRLVLAPAPRGRIACRGILLREQQRPFYSILDKAFPRTKTRLPMCSVCKRLLAFEMHWLEPEEAIRQLDLFDSIDLPQLEYVVCDDCLAPRDRWKGGAAAA